MKKLLLSAGSIALLGLVTIGVITRSQAQLEPAGNATATTSSTLAPAEIVKAASITRSNGGITALEQVADQRVLLKAKETVAVHLDLNAAAKGEVKVIAPNGGTFDRKGGPLVGEASKLAGALDFQFTPGADRGRYTVEVTQGNDTQTLEFWVGAEPPQGKPGPALVFKGY